MANLGLRLDPSGFLRGAAQAEGALNQLGDAAPRVERKLERATTAMAYGMSSFAASGQANLGSVARAFENLAFAWGPIVGGIALGVGSIIHLFEELDRQSKEAADHVVRNFDGMSANALQAQVTAARSHADALFREIQRYSEQTGQTFWDLLMNAGGAIPEELMRNYRDAITLTHQLATAQRDYGAEVAKREAQRALEEHKRELERIRDAWAKVREERDRYITDLYARNSDITRDAPMLPFLGPHNAPNFAGAIGAPAAIDEGFSRMHEHRKVEKSDLDEILFKMRMQLDVMKEQEAAASRQREIWQGALLGSASAIFASGGGPLGGVLAGAINGIPGGPVGVAAGAFQAAIGGLLGMGDAAKQERERLEQLRSAHEAFTDSVKVELGLMTPLQYAINNLTREYGAQRDALRGGMIDTLRQIYGQEIPAWALALSGITQEQIAMYDELNGLESENLNLLRQRAEQDRQNRDTELQVRLLRAQGLSEEADYLALILQQTREREQAERDKWDAESLALLEQVQTLERIGFQMDKLKAKIDALEQTINALQDFRNSLLLSPESGLSPTDQYAEAQRQYQEILDKALGGDQGAASRLPAAAQTFLEFSRLVNASGSDFQNDFQKVLSDTQAVIDKFQDLKSIEELQLEELIKIRDGVLAQLDRLPPGTLPTQPAPEPPPYQPPPTDDPSNPPPPEEQSFRSGATITVLQAGFTQTVKQLAVLTAKVDENTAQLRRNADGMAAQG